MTLVSVVIPTIQGREALYEQTVNAYRNTTPPGYELEVITPRDHPTIGEAWTAGAKVATGEYLHLSADDVTPHDGWLVACVEAVAAGCYPAPKLTRPDGSVEACGSLGGGMLLGECLDWTPCVTSAFPFMPRPDEPLLVPAIHYYADDYLAHRARVLGLKPVVRTGFHLTHHEGTVGRPAMVARSAQDRQTFLDIVTNGGPKA